jgi:FkbM family methyltransferase
MVGFDLVRFLPHAHPLARKVHLLHSAGVDVVLDVGANVGQYVKELRNGGYRGRVVSFEPLAAPFAALRSAANADGAWECVNVALGARAGSGVINVSANTESSSFLAITSEHVQSAPAAAFVGREEIRIETLASALQTHARESQRPFVKIDTQGYEREILEGAGASFERVLGVQVEMSLARMYEGEATFGEMLAYLEARGFVLFGVEASHTDPRTGRVLQLDGTFFRERAFDR